MEKHLCNAFMHACATKTLVGLSWCSTLQKVKNQQAKEQQAQYRSGLFLRSMGLGGGIDHWNAEQLMRRTGRDCRHSISTCRVLKTVGAGRKCTK